MNWHCEDCGYFASVGLVEDLRPGLAASCPVCQATMVVEEPLGSPELVLAAADAGEDMSGTAPWMGLAAHQ